MVNISNGVLTCIPPQHERVIDTCSMLTKQWLQVEVVNEIVMRLLLSFISNLDFKPLFVPIEANLGSVY